MSSQIPPAVVEVVRHLRCGNFLPATAAFLKVPRDVQSSFPALHEALVLACAHVPDAHAAAAVLRDMPHPTLAAYAHVATAYCRERNPAAAVDLLEALPQSGLPLDPRVVESVARYARKEHARASAKSDGGRGVNPLKRPRNYRAQSPLLRRLGELKAVHGSNAPGLSAISLSAADFFEDGGGDVDAWITSRNLEHELSMKLTPNLRGKADARPSGPTPDSKSPPEILTSSGAGPKRAMEIVGAESLIGGSGITAFHSSKGSISRTDELWNATRQDSIAFADTTILAAAVSSYLACGWRGNSRALDAVSSWLDEHSVEKRASDADRPVAPSLLSSPTQRAMLLTAATSAIAASALAAPHRALEVCDALSALSVPAFDRSLPFCGAIFKVIRQCRLPLPETIDRIRERRVHLAQLDEQGFSLALAAILESSAPAPEKWAAAKKWVDDMRLAGINLTLHTYNAFVAQLRFMNDPELATSLLRDIAHSGLTPSAYTYSLIFGSCVVPGPYTHTSRQSALPSSTLLRVLQVVEEHMAEASVPHTRVSQLTLAKAYAHLGCEEKAVHHFDLGIQNEHAHASVRSAGPFENHLCTHSSLDLRNFNQMIYSFAHSRCKSPDGPRAAFRLYERMRKRGIQPDLGTVQSLLAACVRIGDHKQAIRYVLEFVAAQDETQTQRSLGRSGLEALLAVLAKSASRSAWMKCEPLLTFSFSEYKRRQKTPVDVSQRAVEFAVLAYARRGHRDICEKLCAMSGYPLEDSSWEVLLSGEGDFHRARSTRKRLHPVSEASSPQHSASRVEELASGSIDAVPLL